MCHSARCERREASYSDCGWRKAGFVGIASCLWPIAFCRRSSRSAAMSRKRLERLAEARSHLADEASGCSFEPRCVRAGKRGLRRPDQAVL